MQAALPFLDEHPLIRPLEDYAKIVAQAAARRAPANSTPARLGQVGFKRDGRANECAGHQPDRPGGNNRQGLFGFCSRTATRIRRGRWQMFTGLNGRPDGRAV